MEKIRITPSTVFLFAFLLIALSPLTSCGQREAREKEDAAFEETRKGLEKDLQAIKEDIDRRIEDIDSRIAEATGDVREKLEIARNEMKKEREKVEDAISVVRDATEAEWEKVKTGATDIYDKARQKTRQITDDIRNWFQ